MIEKHTTKDRVRCILHWFTGTSSEAQRAASLGCYFSINGQMLTSKRGQALVKEIPVHLLLTETDYPFTQESGRPALPWDVRSAMQTLASTCAVSHEKMIELLKRNALKVISFAGI